MEIKIGKQFSQEFKGIVNLFKAGFSADQVKDAYDGVIKTPVATFVFDADSDGVNGADASEAHAAEFTATGASWFSSLRGEPVNNDKAEWLSLIDRVASKYHEEFSFIEYKDSASSVVRGAAVQTAKKFAGSVLSRLFEDPLVMGEAHDAAEDIYGLNMRLEISSGAGLPEPVLCKVFFRRSDGMAMTPLSATTAKGINDLFVNNVPDDDGENTAQIPDADTVNEVFTALKKLILPVEGGNDFSSCAYFGEPSKTGDKTDYDKILNLLNYRSMEDGETKTLECNKIHVLGISHVQWKNAEVVMSCQGRPVLKVTVGFNDRISLACANCGTNAPLIENNEVVFPPEENKRITLDPAAEGFGLSEQDIQDIRERSVLRAHLVRVSCPGAKEKLPFTCTRLACASQLFEATEGMLKCKDCTHPEVVYRDIFASSADDDWQYRYTPSLCFESSSYELVDKKDVMTCSCCGRKIASTPYGRCPTCRSMQKDKAKAKQLYNKYKYMLDIKTRTSLAAEEKLCAEDDFVIVFSMGKTTFVFNKVQIKETGLINAPVQVQRRDK